MSIIEKPGSKRATYQDVLDAPPHKVAEVIDGVLYTMPRPAVPHSIAGSALGWLIGGPFGHSRGQPGGWWIVDEPELHLGEDIVVPDIAGWRRERVQNYPNAAYWEVAPDWLCEVLSPSTRKIDLGPKSAIYSRERVKHMWMVDPDARSLETYTLRGGHWRRLAKLTGNQQVSQPPFEAVSFPLSDLWGLPTPVVPHRRQPQVHDKEMIDDRAGLNREKPTSKVCPVCRHVFQGNGWEGIDAHWKSKHQADMPYDKAWPLIRDGNYTPRSNRKNR